MSVTQPDHGDSHIPDATARDGDGTSGGAQPAGPAVTPVPAGGRSVPRTRWGAAWVGVCAAVLAAVALIVFMLQNTRPVEVTFLWMRGTLPLALALLIAGVGCVLIAMVFGVARMTQLRRLARRRHD